MENYKLLGKIGKGAHGLVFKARDLRNGKTVALKQIAILNTTNGIPKNTMREICSLRALQFKNIVKFVEIFNVDSAVVIVMEYFHLSLAQKLKDPSQHICLAEAKAFAQMILMGVHAMHLNHIMHRDLKPANLLINEAGILKIADFGLARIYNSKVLDRLYTHQVGTRWYRAPELLYGAQKYAPSIDMWAVGCIVAEINHKQPLFPGENDIAQLAIVLGTLGTPNEDTWPGHSFLPDYNKITFASSKGVSWNEKLPDSDPWTIDLISKLLLYNQGKRLTAKEALHHRLFFEHPLPRVSKFEKPTTEERKSPSWHFNNFDEVITTRRN